MRILILTHNYPQNKNDRKDAGIFLHDFAHELAIKNEVYVLAPNFIGKKEKDKSVPVSWFHWRGGSKKLGNLSITSPSGLIQTISLMWSGSRATYLFCKKNKIDFVLAAWAFPSGLFAFVTNVILGTPYATWSLGSDINIYAKYPVVKQLVSLVLRKASFRFSNSFALSKQVESLSGKKCLFLPAVTNIKNVVTNSVRNNTTFTFLFIGRLESVKGVDVLLEAAAMLPLSNRWRVLIGGDGSMSETLKTKMSKLKLKENVQFLGRLGEQEVPEYMSQSNFLVIPSRSESLPLVMIEAAKMGLPVIAANVGDCKRMILKYKSGEYFEKENPSALSSKMVKVMSTKKSRYQQGLKQLSDDFTQKRAVSIFTQYVS